MDISLVLRDWPYDTEQSGANIRKVPGIDDRLKLQIRLRNGILQWEADGRPDDTRPYGCETVAEHCGQLLTQLRADDEGLTSDYVLRQGLIEELRQEIGQFHRRMKAFFKIGDYRRALRDADHCLRAIQIARRHSPDVELAAECDKNRPELLCQQGEIAAHFHLQHEDARGALQALNRGIRQIEDFYREYDLEDILDLSEERDSLISLRRSVRERYGSGLEDSELLNSLKAEQELAIREEQYEMAARLRDKIHTVRTRIGNKA